MDYVLAPSDVVWNKIDNPRVPGVGFAFSESVIDEDYTGVYSAQLGLIGPGGSSKPHRDPYNHAFYFVKGTGSVHIGQQTWDLEPGTIVKIPRGEVHGFENTGDEDLVFLVVYDPPYVAGSRFEKK
ncbi:cupin domain-containing protein [Amycolatopsis sp. FDAARGOS 1241]|uniref:cupin domain-containing protein n=1 Tax=Amycolatopsis sp. FDAARGOS 1241 TaxID=2778070 RepID=UPI0019526143|nr:cupin domain-containing protein [Amycolatopsis sp. FDAARGOS 1241]QRP48553.1 cupin domain-containing protein [Amycolatopsis sp. FDAARGOS 1241]